MKVFSLWFGLNTPLTRLICLCLTLIPFYLQAQPRSDTPSFFEGKVVYQFTMEDRTGQMSAEQMQMFIGTEQVYTLKGSMYKSETNGMLKMTQYYLGQDTLYNFFKGADSLLWIDAQVQSDSIIDYRLEQSVDTVAGIVCDLLIIETANEHLRYYFNKDYAINPEGYQNHTYGFWKFCIEKTGALPLRSVSEAEDMFVEIRAKELNAQKIEDKEFMLPELPRKKNPEE